MLNKVLAFFSEIIHSAWQWSNMTLLPLPPARLQPGARPGTRTDSYFRRGTAGSRPRRLVQSIQYTRKVLTAPTERQ